MPNKPRPENPARAIRIEDELWERAKAAARRLDITVSEFARHAIAEHVQRQEKS